MPSELPIVVDREAFAHGEPAFQDLTEAREGGVTATAIARGWANRPRQFKQQIVISCRAQHICSILSSGIAAGEEDFKLCNMKPVNYLPPSSISLTFLPPQVIRLTRDP
jgi:hypothetical protein